MTHKISGSARARKPGRKLLALAAVLALSTACEGRIIDDDPAAAEGEAPSGDEPLVCEDDFQCPARSLCRGGLCEEAGAGCASKSECTLGDVCVEGACVPPTGSCSSSEECPGASVCDGFSRQCFDPNATGCGSANDCMLEPGCEDGCTCEGNGTCAPVLPGEGEGEGEGEGPVDPPPPAGGDIDLGGFILDNREHAGNQQVGVLPDGLTLAAGQILVIGRDASRAAFESFWGVSFGSDVVYLNAEAGNSGVPIVNGDERWELLSPVGSTVDGVTITGAKNKAYSRTSAGAATDSSNWLEGSTSDATPGATSLPSTGVGLVISEWSDAQGEGSQVYDYEFVELYYAP